MVNRRPLIAITGATGFIGGALARALAANGYRVRAIVRPRSRHKRLPDMVERIDGELDDDATLDKFLSTADALVHCAGAVRGATRAAFIHTNATMTERLAQAVRRCPSIEQAVLVSSLAASEPHISPYSASKFAGEQAFVKGSSTNHWVVLRPPAVYGPGDTEILPLFQAMAHGIAPVWGDTRARFSLIYIDDLIHAIECCLSAAIAPSGVYELHDGHPDGYSLDEVISTASHVLRRRITRITIPQWVLSSVAALNAQVGPLLGYAPMLTSWKLQELRHPRWVCDNSAIVAATDWAPKVSLKDGLPFALRGS